MPSAPRARRLSLAALSVAGLVLTAHSSRAAETANSRTALLEHLAGTREAFLASIAGLSEAQWSWKPAPDKWSIAECAEHVTRAESFIREIARGGMSTPMAAEGLAKSHGKVDTVIKFVTDRSGKFQAPEPLNPMQQGGVRSRDAMPGDFNFERGRTTEMAAGVADLNAYAAMHPGFQELDLEGWLFFLSGHTQRHTMQIAEVKATAGYPKN